MPADARWNVVQRHSELNRRPWLEVYSETVDLPDRRLIPDFYTIEMQDFGVVAAFTEHREIVAERLYRHGSRQMTWSLPAGYVQEGESPLDATVRELREETGYEAEDWVSTGRFIVDGNRGCGWCHCFVAHGAHYAQEPKSDDLAAVETALVPWQRLLELLAAGEITELACVAAIGLAAMRVGI